jgi:hypothetical protein
MASGALEAVGQVLRDGCIVLQKGRQTGCGVALTTTGRYLTILIPVSERFSGAGKVTGIVTIQTFYYARIKVLN